MAPPNLIVITGPVGGDKSTVALALAERLRRAGRRAAVIDLDLVYCMARQGEDNGEEETWAIARRGAAALADAFFAGGMGAVVIEGEFFTPEEFATLREALATPATWTFATLDVSYERALAHVAGDSTRGMSRDPDFLKHLHEQFRQALPYLRASSLILDADSRTPGELAAEVHVAMPTQRSHAG